jgi:hypothetical protein
MPTTAERLQTFVFFVAEHLSGDEKGEAQLFLDRFFHAFGHEGAIDAGATYEERIHKGSKKGKTGFADLVWKPRVLIKMKKREPTSPSTIPRRLTTGSGQCLTAPAM